MKENIVKNNIQIRLGIIASTLRAEIKSSPQIQISTREEHSTARRGRRRPTGRDLARGRGNLAGENKASTAVATSGELGHGRGRESKRNCRATAPGRGLYASAAGSPDAPYEAPDASGDHRTKTQRGFQTSRPPDAGLSVRCPRARLAEHRTHITGRNSDTVPASGECCPAHSPHRTHRDSVRCTSWSFFNLALRLTFTQLRSNFKKTQINTKWNWYE